MSESPKTNETPEKKQPVNPQPLSPETPAATPAAERVAGKPSGTPAPKPTKPVAKPVKESRPRRFFRRVLYWTILILVLFSAGVLVAYFVRVQPLEQQKAQALSAQATAEAKTALLQTQLSTAQSDSGHLSSANAHILLLRASTDVATARMNLALNAAADAKKALAGTTDTLTKLASYSSTLQPDLTSSAKQRLALVLTEIDKDPQTAASDLGILSDQLTSLEKNLFPGQ